MQKKKKYVVELRKIFIFIHTRETPSLQIQAPRGAVAQTKLRANREFHMLTSDTFGEPSVRCDTDASIAPEFQNAGQQTLSPKET